MEIIVKKRESESVRRAREYLEQTRRHYYGREQRDGSRFKSKAGTKEQIKKALDEAG
jgi:hypothetical protein